MSHLNKVPVCGHTRAYRSSFSWTSCALACARGASMKVPEEGPRLLLEVSKRSIRKYLKLDDMSSYAAALAYRTLFAIVPFLALLVALLWFLEIGGSFFEWLSDQTSSGLHVKTLQAAITYS